jgi:hypothetical protein
MAHQIYADNGINWTWFLHIQNNGNGTCEILHHWRAHKDHSQGLYVDSKHLSGAYKIAEQAPGRIAAKVNLLHMQPDPEQGRVIVVKAEQLTVTNPANVFEYPEMTELPEFRCPSCGGEGAVHWYESHGDRWHQGEPMQDVCGCVESGFCAYCGRSHVDLIEEDPELGDFFACRDQVNCGWSEQALRERPNDFPLFVEPEPDYGPDDYEVREPVELDVDKLFEGPDFS